MYLACVHLICCWVQAVAELSSQPMASQRTAKGGPWLPEREGANPWNPCQHQAESVPASFCSYKGNLPRVNFPVTSRLRTWSIDSRHRQTSRLVSSRQSHHSPRARPPAGVQSVLFRQRRRSFNIWCSQRQLHFPEFRLSPQTTTLSSANTRHASVFSVC